jgi:hypothetical protein
MRLAVSILMLAAITVASLAQSTYGSILGTVSDPTGVRIARVELTVNNRGEDTFHTVIADDLGNYEALNL